MNRIVHFEIHADDPERAAEFYRKTFGWDIKKWESPVMEYWMVMTAPEGDKSPGINGGLLRRPGPAPAGDAAPNAFVCTVDVPNIDEAIKSIEANGGKTVVPKMALPGMAWLAQFRDTEGNIFGVYQEDKNAK